MMNVRCDLNDRGITRIQKLECNIKNGFLDWTKPVPLNILQ